MDKINQRFLSQFRGHWIGVKFYKEEPALKGISRPKDVRFCEAIKKAILGPVLLDKGSINCLGAHFAFGWASGSQKKNELFNQCQDKSHAEKSILESIFACVPRLKEPPRYIGLNTYDEPDFMMSYLAPEEAMKVIKIYHNSQGKNLEVSLCSMMSICGGVAVRTFQENKISFSFGCDDSRKYAEIGRDRLAVGIPKSMFDIFVSKEKAYAKSR